MIVKMKFLSVTGPKDDIERMAAQYLSKYEIQLENALTELKTVRNLRAYTDKNPYEELIRQAKEYLPAGLKTDKEFPDMTPEQAEAILKEAESHLTELRNQRAELSEKREKCKSLMEDIDPFRGLVFDVHSLLKFRYVKYRFGRISKEYFDKFERYVYDTLDTIFYICSSDDEYVWLSLIHI